ncbi:sensor histidine kinase [Propionibacteriaceae bacterium Y2011]
MAPVTAPGTDRRTGWFRRLVRGFAWLMLGAAIGVATTIAAFGLLSLAPGTPDVAVGVLALLGGACLGLVPGARELEVTAARTMLGIDDELTTPQPPRPVHRVQTVAWVVAHQLAGLLCGFALLGLVPGVLVLLYRAVTGWRDPRITLPAPQTPLGVLGYVVLAIVSLALLPLLCWLVVRLMRALAGRVLGPTSSDRLLVAEQRLLRDAEHARLARELHDGIGHALTIISVQASAGRRVINRDPDGAATALGAIEDTSRQAQTELDALLGMLREDRPPDGGLARVPDLASVVSAHRRAGMELLSEIDLPQRLPALLDTTVRRIVTEALTNAHRHGGPGPVELTITHDRREIVISCQNRMAGGSSPGGGRGLAGIAERVALFGGTLTAEPADDHHWRLAAVLPIPATSPAAPFDSVEPVEPVEPVEMPQQPRERRP